MIPKNAVRFAVLQAFDRAGVELSADKVSGDREEFKGELRHRKVRIRLTPFSEPLTRATLSVEPLVCPWEYPTPVSLTVKRNSSAIRSTAGEGHVES